MEKKIIAVIGGGAAGFFCAVNAARLHPENKIVLFERSSRLLSKVKVSGGGRCNVTHACFSISEMIKRYPRGGNFLKKAFHQFFTTDTVSWFSERGVQLKEEADGRMFPITDNSQTIIDCLLNEASKYNVDIRMNAAIAGIEPLAGKWKMILAAEREFIADKVVIACGGFPKASQFEWLQQIKHTIAEPVPSLFTFNIPKHPITKLMGITIEKVTVKVSGSKLQEEGPLLITHWGLSGPAVLKLSAWGAREFAAGNYNFSVVVNWLPEFNENSLREKLLQVRFDHASQKIVNRNPFGLPSRLWEFFLEESEINKDMRWADLPAKQQNKLVKICCAYVFDVNGKTTFKEEFVTAGGILTDEIDVNTMESRRSPGIYFAGEIINVDGITGGYNFQNAWTTGWIAANNL